MKNITFSIVAILIFNWLSAQTFILKSNDLGGQFRSKNFSNTFGCNGENKSPELFWENAPQGTQSFAVTMYDKDAPTGSGFWHWVVYNIPAGTRMLPVDAGNISQQNLPKEAINGLNDAGIFGYLGPCPPVGQSHLYLITVYALKTKLTLDKNASSALVGFMLNANSLEKASLAIYGQQ